MSDIEVKIGISAISWLNDDMPELTAHITVEQALSDMQKIGYSGVENAGLFPKDSESLKALLGTYDLELVSGWYSGKLGERSFEEEKEAILPQISLFKELGCRVIVYGETSGGDREDTANPLSQRPTALDFQEYAKKVNDLAKFCNDFGVPLAHHHHMGTMVQNEDEVEALMDATTEVNLTFDTGHLYMAGGDVNAICQKYVSRIGHFHLKDIRQDVLDNLNFTTDSFRDAFIKGMFTVPGDGCIDYQPLIQILRQANYDGWFVIEAEQDPKKADPFEYGKKGYDVVHQLLTNNGYKVIE